MARYNIYKRKDGRWEGRISRGKKANGKRKTKLIITDPKSESSMRSIPLTESMVEFLKEFKGKDNEFVLSGKNKPLEPRTMQYRFAKILKNVNLPSVHYHSLRHVFASTCIKLGFDNKNVFLIKEKKPVSIAEKVLFLLNNFEVKKEFELEAYQTFKSEYSFELFSQKLLEYYYALK